MNIHPTYFFIVIGSIGVVGISNWSTGLIVFAVAELLCYLAHEWEL